MYSEAVLAPAGHQTQRPTALLTDFQIEIFPGKIEDWCSGSKWVSQPAIGPCRERAYHLSFQLSNIMVPLAVVLCFMISPNIWLKRISSLSVALATNACFSSFGTPDRSPLFQHALNRPFRLCTVYSAASSDRRQASRSRRYGCTLCRQNGDEPSHWYRTAYEFRVVP